MKIRTDVMLAAIGGFDLAPFRMENWIGIAIGTAAIVVALVWPEKTRES